MTESHKVAHALIIDANTVITNNPAPSSLLTSSEHIYTVPSVILEIRDLSARQRFNTTLKPFINLREPSESSLRFVKDFARKTGDINSLSTTDLKLCALAYELEVERNGGDWRLRRVPGQKQLNGRPPTCADQDKDESAKHENQGQGDYSPSDSTREKAKETEIIADTEWDNRDTEEQLGKLDDQEQLQQAHQDAQRVVSDAGAQSLTQTLAEARLSNEDNGDDHSRPDSGESQTKADPPRYSSPIDEDSTNNPTDPATTATSDPSSDSEGEWITPKNITRKNQNHHSTAQPLTSKNNRTLQVATLTQDFAMQNLLLAINLNLISPNLSYRIRRVKNQTVQRCHACFYIVKPSSTSNTAGAGMEGKRQFCPRCGGANTLTRVTTSTNPKTGQLQLHLKQNFQYNNKGNKYSIPKPVAGAANSRKVKGGGKGGWGNDLILAEDQKEYVRAVAQEKRMEKRSNLLDEDFWPGLMGGKDGGRRSGGRVKVGAGRNINSIKRK